MLKSNGSEGFPCDRFAWLGTDHLLDEGVVCCIHAGAQRVQTLPITVVGRVACGGQHPVLEEKAQAVFI